MRPRKYPYSGRKKRQSDEQIAKLKRYVEVNSTNISYLTHVIQTLRSHQNCQ